MNSYLASLGPSLANHLWQSTAFAVVVWLLTLALRRNHARVRYSLWFAASIKFLIPFSLLVSAGNLLPHPKRPVVPVVYSAMDAVEEPFDAAVPPPATPLVHIPTPRERAEAILPSCLGFLWLVGVGTVLFGWWNRWRVVSASLHQATPAIEGRELEILRRLETVFSEEPPRKALPLFISPKRLEPGIFGVFRPVLLWPEQLSQRLDDEQVEAVIAHELTHVRRRDNLTALVHMLVEAAFWFHPLVWWMERQMVKEREQACDEAVVEMGGNTNAYAESLLKTCRFCIESPLPCVAGVTGADLRQRVFEIVTGRIILRMTWPKKLLLVGAAVSVVAGPMTLGLLCPLVLGTRHTAYGQVLYTSGPLPSFEVATIRPMPNGYPPTPTPHGGSIVRLRFTPKMMVGYAYNLPDFSEGRILNSAGWTNDNYEIEGKISDSDYAAMQKMTSAEKNQQIQLMVQSLLRDRMKLKVHLEKRDETIYALEAAKGGMKLAPAKEGVPKAFSVTHRGQNYQLTANGGTLDGLALLLGRQPEIGGRSVVNKTGITGSYDVTLHWIRTGSPGAVTDDASTEDENAPSFFTAIKEQLGLRLAPRKDQVDYIIVDHIEKPSSVDGAEVVQGPMSIGALTQVPANPTISPAGSTGEAASNVIAKVGRVVSAQIVSDARGVDFGAYMQRLQSDVGRNGTRQTASGAEADAKSGIVVIRLAILPDGRIGAMKLEQSSGDKDLDKAAWYAVTSEGSFPPLPTAFHGPRLEILLKFLYNMAVAEPSARMGPAAIPSAPSHLSHIASSDFGAPAVGSGIGGASSAPVLLYSVEPEFTENARKAKASGEVLVSLRVDNKGNPTRVRTLRGLGFGLDEKAIEAIKQYRYKPAMEDGKPVPAQLNVAVKFQVF